VYAGSFDIWTRNRISKLLDLTSAHFENLPVEGWINGDNFVRTTESFGILPMPEEQEDKLNMYSFNPQFAKDTNARHCYLAKKQNTQIESCQFTQSLNSSSFKQCLQVPKPNVSRTGRISLETGTLTATGQTYTTRCICYGQ